MTTHTPGPWVAKTSRTVYAGDDIVASCTEKADARLIAQAPAMREILERMVTNYDTGTWPSWHGVIALIDATRAILRAVEG